MKSREFGLTQVEAAAVAGFSERSGQRIEAGDYQLNQASCEMGAPVLTLWSRCGRVKGWRSADTR